MKDFVARAMQVACLDQYQLEKLHKAEQTKGYCFPNWNIQRLFGLKSIKDCLGIPIDEGTHLAHAQRLENELLDAGYTKIEMTPETMIMDAWRWTHAFDLVVQRNPKGIDFNYRGQRRSGNFLSQLQ